MVLLRRRKLRQLEPKNRVGVLKVAAFISLITMIVAVFMYLRNYFNTSRSDKIVKMGEDKPTNEPKTNPLKKRMINNPENDGELNLIDDKFDKENSAEEDEEAAEDPDEINEN